MRIKRDKEETKNIKEILKQLNDEDEHHEFEDVEELMRLGPYIEDLRPVNNTAPCAGIMLLLCILTLVWWL